MQGALVKEYENLSSQVYTQSQQRCGCLACSLLMIINLAEERRDDNKQKRSKKVFRPPNGHYENLFSNGHHSYPFQIK
jgi:hypothetical protein